MCWPDEHGAVVTEMAAALSTLAFSRQEPKRFGRVGYDGLAARGKLNLDLLGKGSLNNQPEPDWRFIEVDEDLRTALEQFSRVSTELDRAV